jgi:hypothetical protein
MHRVLKPGGRALIIDLRKNVSWNEIESYVNGLHVGPMSTWMTKWTFKHMLLKRAYTLEQIDSLATASDFKCCEIACNDIGMEITFYRRDPVAEQAA